MSDAGHARYLLLLVGLIGDCSFGGIVFGWQAITEVWQDLAYHTTDCTADEWSGGPQEGAAPDQLKCVSHDTKLLVVWVVGTTAANFAPALAGPALDLLGPRVVSVTGALLSGMGLILTGARQRAINCAMRALNCLLTCASVRSTADLRLSHGLVRPSSCATPLREDVRVCGLQHASAKDPKRQHACAPCGRVCPVAHLRLCRESLLSR